SRRPSSLPPASPDTSTLSLHDALPIWRPDQALLQQRVRLHPTFEAIAYKGIPDVRVVLYRNQTAMAMLRLPTKESNGRANLHQGDRKSTRLNSSHQIISYAVFCLKKKR